MRNFVLIIYNSLLLPLLRVIVNYASMKKKIDRHRSIKDLYTSINSLESDSKRVWFHSSSMGEFEQAKPIIELLKERDKDIVIICTFFSPSGYEHQKDYEYADLISYIPLDSKREASEFVSIVKPDIAVFVRYDLWVNFLIELKKNNSKVLLVNATISGAYFKFYFKLVRPYYKYVYSLLDMVFCFNAAAKDYYNSFDLNAELYLSSDTRLDRIAKIVNRTKQSDNYWKEIKEEGYWYLVVGSSWESDEKLIFDAVKELLHSNIKLRIILVPHKPSKENVDRIVRSVDSCVLLSEIDNGSNKLKKYNKDYLIVDRVGLLLKIYSIADIAFVGGGYIDGVHSTAEPAGYSLPILSGPNIGKSPDAIELRNNGGLIVVKTAKELVEVIVKLTNDRQYYNEISRRSYQYIERNIGSTEVIANNLLELLSNNN